MENGDFYINVSYKTTTNQLENNCQVVAIDPGVRTFLTYFSEENCGKIGEKSASRIQRLCYHLDDLIGRMTKEKGGKKRNIKEICL
jgi:putative transposase